MGKILIIGFTKIQYMPYLTFYLNAINLENNDVTLYYWNRDCKEDVQIDNRIKIKKFEYLLSDSEPKIKKIPAFLLFRKEVINFLKQESYDYIIVLHTLPGVLIADYLLKYYSNRFVLDYRDYTYEKYEFYKQIIDKLTKASKITFVSSNAFRVYLPKLDKIYTSHNITLDTLENRNTNRKLSTNPIRIRYWGLIRYADTNIKIINCIKNDKRFEMHFHGRMQKEAEIIQEFCLENKINNVFFHGEYKPHERIEFARNTDLIQNAQDYDEITKNAVSNKFYDGAIFYIPQICTNISYMGQCLELYHIGLPSNMDDNNLADTLFNYISCLNYEEFKKNCDEYINVVIKEYKEGINILKALFG